MYESVPTTTIWPDDDPVPDEPVPADEAPAAAELFPLPDEPVPLTCWPTVRSTDATVPEMVEVRLASLRFVCAVDREDSAEVTAA
jgi:hypothetical protein